MTSAGKRIVRGAAVISLFGLVGKCLGFVQKQIMAFCFGTGAEADAFFLAFQSIGFAFIAIPQKAIAPFLPLFSEKMAREGEPEAWRFARTVGLMLAGVLGVALIAGILCAPQLVNLTASFEHESTSVLATRLVRIVLPASFFLGLAALTYLLLNAYKRFAFPALGDVVNRILIIAVVLVLYRRLGIRGMAVAVVVGGLACLAVQVVALLWRTPGGLRGGINFSDPAIRKLAVLVPPVLAGSVLAQIRTILDFRFASEMGAGYLSSLSFAKVLPDTLTLLVPAAVGVSIYPFFADLAARNDREGLGATLLAAMRMLAFLFVPATVALIALRLPLVQLVFERGKFTAESVALTTGPLAYYSLGMTAFAVEIILIQCYFALKDTKTPFVIGLLTLAVHVSIILCLKGEMMHKSIAMAAAISKTLKVIVLFALLRGSIGSLHWRANLLFGAKVLAASAVAGAVMWLAYPAVGRVVPAMHGGHLVRAIRLAAVLGIAVGAGALSYAAAAVALRVEEFTRLLARAGIMKRRSHA